MAIYFFYGDEDYLIEKELEKYKSKLDKNFSSMNYKVYDNPNYADMIAILRTQPMMFGKLMVVINSDKIFSQTYEDKQIKEITSSLEGNQESLDIFFVVNLPRNEGKKLDARKKLFKILSKYNAQEYPTIKTYKTAELSNFIEHIGNNLRQFSIELEKIALLAYPETKIKSDIIKEICSSNQDLFNFTDLIMKGKKHEALLELNKLLDKKHPLEILATTQTMLRKWILIKLKHKSMSTLELSRLVGQNEYVVKLTIPKLKNVALKDLVHLKESLTNAEYKIKSGESLDIELEVENAIIR